LNLILTSTFSSNLNDFNRFALGAFQVERVYIRVMPGKPHSPNPYQRKPYVTHQRNGNAIDKQGKIVEKDALDAHIPYEEFVYRE
jgi:hypothetical protein